MGRVLLPGTMMIDVEDTGTGIPEDKLDKLFDPFFTTKKVGKGNGFGLSICHEIVEKHDGRITFQSKENEGTEFMVALPVVWEYWSKMRKGIYLKLVLFFLLALQGLIILASDSKADDAAFFYLGSPPAKTIELKKYLKERMIEK